MNRWLFLTFLSVYLLGVSAFAQISVPTAPPENASDINFRDARFGVRFHVPPGWNFTRKDGEVSSFRLDARTAMPRSELRAVAAIDFNPYPLSVLSGALFYYSVARHSTDAECERQATKLAPDSPQNDIQNIGGMDFTHGHDEHGTICVEARDEVYTAFRKGSCYRFDLTMNTFCSQSSGALDLSEGQMRDIEQRMTHILSTVELEWEKSGPRPVPAPPPAPEQRRRISPAPSRATSAVIASGSM